LLLLNFHGFNSFDFFRYLVDNVELGTACGKLFRVGVMSITDAGDSDIIEKQAL
jgi:ribosomal protein L30E